MLAFVATWRSAFALVALLVGCSSGSSTTPGGGGGGSAGKTGAAGKGGGGQGGAAGSTAGTTGTGGTGGVTGTGGVAGAAGAGAGAEPARVEPLARAEKPARAAVRAPAARRIRWTGAGGAAGAGTGGVDAGTHATDGGCQGVDLPGIGVPAGTVVTASSSLTLITLRTDRLRRRDHLASDPGDRRRHHDRVDLGRLRRLDHLDVPGARDDLGRPHSRATRCR